MKTVWLVEKGSYSDYHIVGVFSSEEHANRVARLVDGPNPTEYRKSRVREWDLDPGIDQLNQGLVQFEVWMLKSGDVYRTETIEPEDFDIELTEESKIHESWDAVTQTYGEPVFLVANVWARDMDHAIKITNEKRTQLIANNEWIVKK